MRGANVERLCARRSFQPAGWCIHALIIERCAPTSIRPESRNREILGGNSLLVNVIADGSAMAVIPAAFGRCRIMIVIIMVVMRLGMRQPNLCGTEIEMAGGGVAMRDRRDD